MESLSISMSHLKCLKNFLKGKKKTVKSGTKMNGACYNLEPPVNDGVMEHCNNVK